MALTFTADTEPVKRTGRAPKPVPQEIITACKEAIKAGAKGESLRVELPTSQVANLRKNIKKATENLGSFEIKTQEIKDPDSKTSVFRFSLHAKDQKNGSE